MDPNDFFGDEPTPPSRPNPFGEPDDDAAAPAAAAARIERSARAIRGLRSQIGAEGLSPSASRQLLDQTATALEAAARAVRALSDGSEA